MKVGPTTERPFSPALYSLNKSGSQRRRNHHKRGPAQFVAPVGVLLQHLLVGFGFHEAVQGEAGIEERIDVGGDGMVEFEYVAVEKVRPSWPFPLVIVQGPV